MMKHLPWQASPLSKAPVSTFRHSRRRKGWPRPQVTGHSDHSPHSPHTCVQTGKSAQLSSSVSFNTGQLSIPNIFGRHDLVLLIMASPHHKSGQSDHWLQLCQPSLATTTIGIKRKRSLMSGTSRIFWISHNDYGGNGWSSAPIKKAHGHVTKSTFIKVNRIFLLETCKKVHCLNVCPGKYTCQMKDNVKTEPQ